MANPNSSEPKSKTQKAQYLFARETEAADDETRMKRIFDCNFNDIASLFDYYYAT